MPNVPVTFPLKLPLSVKLPVSVVWPVKHEPLELLRVKLVTLTPPPLVSVNVVVKV